MKTNKNDLPYFHVMEIAYLGFAAGVACWVSLRSTQPTVNCNVVLPFKGFVHFYTAV
ncbi:hypothetical protein I6F65_14260 [Pseudoalteromonas sp. SWXJZ94C]|uniref:hypothetical protein n=1 Tax=Pseudoalteromonas sp. SWXJZ94C TaxID=2792065 RepID=UPI0018CF3DF9|nr:hypothetical protein [Pseudoalteromonas sp. SWXJZ94C]MBH0058122.1 hypothetical protein [Pseudoalteromonas sp. SWXJZ94C]